LRSHVNFGEENERVLAWVVHMVRGGLVNAPRVFADDPRGGVAVIVALSLPVLAVLTVGAIDLASVSADRTLVQDSLDQAALNAAQQLSASDSAALRERTLATLDLQLAKLKDRATWTSSFEVAPDGSAVTVKVVGARASYFGDMLPPGGWPLRLSSTATSMGQVPLCVLSTGLDDTNRINVRNTATMAANGCLVHSNGDIQADNTALLSAATVQASGTAKGRITPQPQVGAPQITDPFASMSIKANQPCYPVAHLYDTGLLTLPAGVHCGDIKLIKAATLNLAPGVHYFLKGRLELAETSKLKGSNVVLIFDKDSDFKFGDKAQINLRGRESGAYAGFVIATTRKNDHTFQISSTAARELLGTIYIPNARLKISGVASDVADQSAWTVIVAKAIEVAESPKLVINSDYAGSSVPVPGGVGPTRRGSRLDR